MRFRRSRGSRGRRRGFVGRRRGARRMSRRRGRSVRPLRIGYRF